MRAKLVLDAKYQKERRWDEESRFTKSIADIKRVLAAERQMWMMYGSRAGLMLGEVGDDGVVAAERERIIRRWRVISVAK
jgi:hypothetical protein